MGVPKFFRYISERYPCLSEIVKEYQIPEFDHLYLDMNGIIHICSHPDDSDAHFRITEDKIFQDIFRYIEVLFRMIKPQKVFFMAVDGVAPRAKMNQQRGRRFRSAKEALQLEAKARQRGEELPTEARFDSNCITPGTEFMARLHEQLKYFIVNKISTDKLWQKCKVILSGQETPGEGEHKIMDYIRYMKAQPGYDPNTRHCLYGLDADLLMLGLCTHEPHFSLLREEVRFGKKSNKRRNIPEQITFYLLHLSLMREYLELEFYSLKDNLPFAYDMEKIIDDWVLMGFLVGNDFIPNLPNLHITNGALPILYNAYMKVLPSLGGYINEEGTLNLPRFEKFMEVLANIDMEHFTEKYADLKYFEAKTGRRPNERERTSYKPKTEPSKSDDDEDMIVFEEPDIVKPVDTGLLALIKETSDMLLEPSTEKPELVQLSESPKEGPELAEDGIKDEAELDSNAEEEDIFNAEFIQHKNDYYMNKLEYEKVTPDVLRSQAEGYVRAIQWNLHYYYNSVCSWSWFYPHHYAPYISDIKDFSNLTFDFQLGKPFNPFEQLLAVLPAASKSLLPVPYQELMINETSPIKDYYPNDFGTDLNGKKQEWEAVVLIPFIEEDILLEAMATCNHKLTPDELKRNGHGPMLIYQYGEEDLGVYEATEYFPNISHNHAHCEKVCVEDLRVAPENLIKGAYPGVKTDVYFPGFPTMKHLKYTGFLDKAKVKVFEQQSRGENMILKLQDKALPPLDVLAKEVLGQSVHVAWPHLVEALVVSVSNNDYRYNSAGEKGSYNVEDNKGNLFNIWRSEKEGITEHYKYRLGVDVGKTDILVHVKVMTGRKYIFSSLGRINLEKQWAIATSAYPFQTIVQNIAVHDGNHTTYQDITSVFSVGSLCFMLGQPNYGAVGEVLEGKDALEKGRVKVSMKKIEEPNLYTITQLEKDIRVRYMPLSAAATKIAISKNLLSRITGSIFIIIGNKHETSEDAPKINIGLNLKFNKKNEEIPGYTRKEGNTWFYSEKAVTLVRSYLNFCPQLFEYLNKNSMHDIYYDCDIFPNCDGKERVKELTSWIKKQPFYSIEHQICGSATLDPEVIQKLEEVVDAFCSKNPATKQIIMQVKPFLLFKPEIQMGNIMPDPTATFQIYDRVINVREGYTVRLGLKGTIIGIHKPSTAKEIETVYDVLFDEPFAGGLALNSSPNRAYRLPKPAIINISHGLRILEQKAGKQGQLVKSLQSSQVQHSQHNAPPYPAYPNKFSENSAFASWNPTYNNYPQSAGPSYNHQFNFNYVNSGPVHNYGGPPQHPRSADGYMPKYSSPFYFPPAQQKPMANQTKQPSQPNFYPNFSHQTQNHVNEQKKHEYDERKQVPIKNVNKPAIVIQKKNVAPMTENASLKSCPKVKPAPGKTTSKPIEPQISKINTDFLKQMLKINETLNSTKVLKPLEENENSLCIQDLFAHHAKAQDKAPEKVELKEEQVFYCVELLSYYQANGLGCPHYQYFELPDKRVQAQITLPEGQIVHGTYQSTKEKASENVAAEVLKILIKGNSDRKIEVPNNFPLPPQQWHHHPKQTAASSSSQKTPPRYISHNSYLSQKDNINSKQDFGAQKRINAIKPPQNKETPKTILKAKSDTSKVNSPNVKKNSITSGKSLFVPLQAVKQQRIKVSNTSNEKDQSKNATSGSSGSSTNAIKDVQSASTSQDSKELSSTVVQKPRRERKMRIAASFPTAMVP